MTIFSNCCQWELPPARWPQYMDYALWLSGSPFTVGEMEEEDIAMQPQPAQPTSVILSPPTLAPVTSPASELLPSPSPLLYMSATNPEQVPKPAMDEMPKPTAGKIQSLPQRLHQS